MNDGRNIFTSNYDGYGDSTGYKYSRSEKGIDDKFCEKINNNGEETLTHNIEKNDVSKFETEWNSKYS